MNNKIVIILLSLVCPPVWGNFIEKTIFSGAIQFPTCLKNIPDVRVYCAGRKISGEVDHETKKVTYAISDYKQRGFWFLMIAKDIQWTSEENTIKYLRVDPNVAYKFYAIEHVLVPEVVMENESKTAIDFTKKSVPMRHTWIIKEVELPDSGQLPDDTIIVYYEPTWIDHLEGGNSFELPKIVVRPDIMTIAGSEEKLHQKSAQILITSLDLDAIHAAVRQEIKQFPNPKTIVAYNI